jgi:hypothetical protein
VGRGKKEKKRKREREALEMLSEEAELSIPIYNKHLREDWPYGPYRNL